MKWSAFSFIFITCLFLACDKRPKHLMVRPLEKNVSDSIYATVFPFDTQPSLRFEERVFSNQNGYDISDSIFIHRLKINPYSGNEPDENVIFATDSVDILRADSVRLKK